MEDSIEGIPVIIRFKTQRLEENARKRQLGIEGIPVIIRFKTQQIRVLNKYYY